MAVSERLQTGRFRSVVQLVFRYLGHAFGVPARRAVPFSAGTGSRRRPGRHASCWESQAIRHVTPRAYRQVEIYARDGAALDRSTMADWVGQVSWLLQPLVDHIRDHILAAAKIHTDDTPLPVLAPGTGRTKTGRLWVYSSRERHVFALPRVSHPENTQLNCSAWMV